MSKVLDTPSPMLLTSEMVLVGIPNSYSYNYFLAMYSECEVFISWCSYMYEHTPEPSLSSGHIQTYARRGMQRKVTHTYT